MMKYEKGAQPKRGAGSSPGGPQARRRVDPDIPQFVSERSPQREAARREQLIRQNVSRRRKRHKKNYILYYILLGIILVITGVTLSFTVFFNIGEITVEGNGSLSAQAIAEASGIKIGDNLLRINTDRAVKSILTQNINIDTVTVKRKFPNRLDIQVELSKTSAVLLFNGQYYSLSQGGRVIKMDSVNSDGGIVVVGSDLTGVKLGDRLENSDANKLDVLQEVLTAIRENSLEENIGYIDLTDIAILKLYYDDRVEMKFGGVTDLGYELGRVKQLIDNQIGSDEIVSIDATLRNGEYFTRYLQQLTLPTEKDAQSKPTGTGETPLTPSEPDGGGDSSGENSSGEGTSSDTTSSEGGEP